MTRCAKLVGWRREGEGVRWLMRLVTSVHLIFCDLVC